MGGASFSGGGGGWVVGESCKCNKVSYILFLFILFFKISMKRTSTGIMMIMKAVIIIG